MFCIIQSVVMDADDDKTGRESNIEVLGTLNKYKNTMNRSL